MGKKVHKRISYRVVVGECMACGISYFNADNISFKWKDITCKKCLKTNQLT